MKLEVRIEPPRVLGVLAWWHICICATMVFHYIILCTHQLADVLIRSFAFHLLDIYIYYSFY